MKTIQLEVPRVMALNMINGRLGFVVLEGPHFLVDWGVLDLRRLKDPARVTKTLDAVIWNLPDMVVMEDVTAKGCLKGAATRTFTEQLAKELVARGIDHAAVKRLDVRAFFAPMGAVTRYAIARQIASKFPELKRRMPYERRAWDDEHHNMTLFVAASFALTYLKQGV